MYVGYIHHVTEKLKNFNLKYSVLLFFNAKANRVIITPNKKRQVGGQLFRSLILIPRPLLLTGSEILLCVGELIINWPLSCPTNYSRCLLDIFAPPPPTPRAKGGGGDHGNKETHPEAEFTYFRIYP
jgi:hypothetical protein